MKIAVIGGGSTYTPELLSGIAQRQADLDVADIALHDISADRLDVVGGMAKRLLAARSFTGQVTTTSDLDEAVDGADFVVIQIRVGGQRARLADETLPLRCGCIGQETTGAGGLAKAMRTVPVVLDIADRAKALAAPDAWIIDFTNPVGIVTRALLDAGHRAVGLCNVAISMQRAIAGILRREPADVRVEHVGLNHLTWVRSVEVDGHDVLPDLIEREAEVLAEVVDSDAALIRRLGMIPSYYLEYYYRHDAVLDEQRRGVPRAATVADIEARLLAMYRDPNVVDKPALLGQRGGAFYSEAANDLMVSLVRSAGDIQIVDVRNEGAVAGLADDDLVELPARMGAGGPEPLGQDPLPPEILGLIQHVAAYERLAAGAAASGDLDVARRALLAHPLIGDFAKVEDLMGLMFEPGGTR